MNERLQTDYVIVGGGSAGCLLANRLSADPGCRVTLIEAGGEGDSFLVEMPVGMARLINHARTDWRYIGEPDPSLGGRHFVWSAGKLLGGCSAINGQVYIRGMRSDYDRWAAMGCDGWSFDEVLPYFRRSARFEGEDPPPSFARGGELSVSPMRSQHPLTEQFMRACESRGLPRLDDYCGGNQSGVFATLATQRDGLRCSSAKAFLAPVRQRANLRVLTECRVESVIIDDRTAVGVRARHHGRGVEIEAAAGVIVSAGTIGSPLLLQRSGIGEAQDLRHIDVPVVHDLPGVGANLQEHPCVGYSRWVDVGTFNSKGPLGLAVEMIRFLSTKRGMLTTPAVQAMAFARTQADLADPDLQLHFLPLSYEVTPETTCSASARMPKRPAVLIMSNVCRPYSRGRVRLRDGASGSPPLIEHPLLGDERDLRTHLRGARLVEALFDAPGLREHVTGLAAPTLAPANEDEWIRYIRENALLNYHPVGTCRMGNDDSAVVDSRLRVRGMQRLHVIDASVMPCLPSANTNAATVMIAEKGAEMILRDGAWPSRQ